MAAKTRPVFSWSAHDAPPASPDLPAPSCDCVLVRYMFDGGKLARDGHLVTLKPRAAPAPPSADGRRTVVVAAEEVLAAIRADGVDMQGYYPRAYEERESSGAWVRMLPPAAESEAGSDETVGEPVWVGQGAGKGETARHASATEHSPKGRSSSVTFTLTLPPSSDHGSVVDAAASMAHRKPRIDVKLCKERVAHGRAGALQHYGFFAIGIVGAKTMPNVGSLWRSAFQMGASYIFTVGARYRSTQNTDTLVAHKRLPYFEFPDWSAFAVFSGRALTANHQSTHEPREGGDGASSRKGLGGPKGAVWVVVEMGGEPLETFKHPDQAIYILGSEDTGLPDSIVQAATHHVALPSERYESYNVAMAGSIVMYDRIAKLRRGEHL